MFLKSAKYYDVIYQAVGKDYAGEVREAHRIIRKHLRSKGNQLLDVACGTGEHASRFARYYRVEGIDLDPKMLAVARKKYPAISFHPGDIRNFRVSRGFDVIVCLFSSIGYVETRSGLFKATQNMSAHLLPGGVLLIEPWFSPAQWHTGRVSTVHADKPDLKITRMSWSSRQGNLSKFECQYLIGTPKGITHATELHKLGLFTKREYLRAFRAAGLEVIHDPKGLDGRGLYIGLKPMDGK